MMSDRVRNALVRVEVAVLAAVLVVAAVGLSVLPLTSAPFVRALVRAVGAERYTGIGRDATLGAAEMVRAFVTDANAPALPSTLDGRPAFDDFAVSHLVDVRAVIIPARALAIAAALLVALWAVLRLRTPRGRVVGARVLRAAGWTLTGASAAALVLGMANFDALFTRFHGLFFASGTWVFPNDALLIQVFPMEFWTAAGACWGVLVLAMAAVMLLSAARMRFTARKYGV